MKAVCNQFIFKFFFSGNLSFPFKDTKSGETHKIQIRNVGVHSDTYLNGLTTTNEKLIEIAFKSENTVSRKTENNSLNGNYFFICYVKIRLYLH